MTARDPNTAGGAKSVGRVWPDPQLRRSCLRLLLNKRTSPVPREQTAALGTGVGDTRSFSRNGIGRTMERQSL